MLLLLGVRAHADEIAVKPGPGPAAVRGKTWLGRMQALVVLPSLAARRDAARTALESIGTQTRPDVTPYRKAEALAKACLAAAPSPDVVDVDVGSKLRGVSIAQLVHECEILLASATSDAERADGAQKARAAELRPLLRGDRVTVFDAEGEPDCDKCAGDAKAIARARTWIYLRGPDGPLATFETLTFVFRGDKLIERKQRVTHERP